MILLLQTDKNILEDQFVDIKRTVFRHYNILYCDFKKMFYYISIPCKNSCIHIIHINVILFNDIAINKNKMLLNNLYASNKIARNSFCQTLVLKFFKHDELFIKKKNKN